MEAKLPVILHDQLSSVDYSCCRFPQKESNEYCCFSQRRKILGNCRLWNGRKMRILEAKKEKRRKTSEAFFRVIFPCVKICKFSFSYYKDQRKSGRLRHFTNVHFFRAVYICNVHFRGWVSDVLERSRA